LKVKDKTVITVFNKIDAYQYIKKDEDDLTPRIKENMSLEELKQSWMANHNTNTIFISAVEKDNIDELKAMLYNEVKKIHVQRYPYDNFLF
jgi:GTPase